MKYVFQGNEYTDLDELMLGIESELDNDEEGYDEWLDEIYGEVEMGGFRWDASRVLAEMDPIAYRCGMSDYTSVEYENIEYDLERATAGDTVYTRVGDIDVYDDDDDDNDDEE